MRYDTPLGSLLLPDAWEDQSLVQATIPAPEDLQVPLLSGRGASVSAAPASFLAARIDVPAGASLAFVVDQRLAPLRKAAVEAVLVDEEPWPHPVYGPLPAVAHRLAFAGASPVMQVMVFVPWRDPQRFTCLTCTAEASSFERHRPALQDAVASYRLPAP